MLPIERDLPDIIQLVKENEITWITIPTGCGKSVGIPGELSKDYRVFCTQPTIPAVISLYEFQKTRISPETVGWSAEGTREFNQDTKIIYATAGYVRKLILSKIEKGSCKSLDFCDVLMVDEIHTGSKDNSIIIDLWLFLKKKGIAVPKLILATATDHGLDELRNRLQGVHFTSDFRRYAVETRFHQHDFQSPDHDNAFIEAAQVARRLLEEKNSHGLVFCSGATECLDMVHLIQEETKNYEERPIEVIPCFAQCKQEEIMRAIMPVEDDTIKIVCATNIAESSITIPDVAWVVNMMTEKRITMIGNRPKLGPAWCSKNSSHQRKGRTGRTLHGCICYFLCTEEFFHRLEEFTPLEIKNSPISNLLIELLDAGLGPSEVISELEIDRLADGINELEITKCIKKVPKKNIYKVTPCGRFVSQMPLDVRTSAGIWYYIDKFDIMTENIFWPVMFFLVIDTYSPSLFWIPRKRKDEDFRSYKLEVESYIEENFSNFISIDPLMSLMEVLRSFFNKYHYKTKPYKYSQWAWNNSINNKKLKEICTLINRVESVLLSKGLEFKFDPDISPRELKFIHKNIIQVLKFVYQDKKITNNFSGYVDMKGYPIKADIIKTVSLEPPSKTILSLSEIIFETKDGRRIVNSSLWVNIDS